MPGLDESESLALLDDFGVTSVALEVADNEAAMLEAAVRVGFPVVLKTAAPGIQHKTEVDGVKLNLSDREAAVAAYQDLESRLGSRVVVSSQIIEHGVEIALGMVHDPVAGALVMVSAGGTLIELLNDKAVAIAPVDPREAAEMIAGLSIAKVLRGVRGDGPFDLDALAHAVAQFSVCVWQLADVLSEVDVNPLLVTRRGCLALDALVVSKQPPE